MSNVVVEAVNTKKGLSEYVQFPFKLYKDDPCWVPPLIEERLAFFDAKQNPFWEHARYQLFVARRNGQLVGTIGGVVNDNHNKVHEELSGGWGFFESINDPDVSGALLQAAEDWTRLQGMNIIRGPLNFSTNDEVGLLIDGFDTPPMIMLTHNPRYYPALVESMGYVKAMDLFAWIYDIQKALTEAPQKLYRVSQKAMEKQGIRVRKIDMKHLDSEVEKIKAAYNGAWQKNWGFVPLTDHEIDHLLKSLKPMVDPNLIFIAETEDGRPAGVSLTMPDLHQALKRSGGGHMWPLGLPKFLLARRHIDQCRLMIMGMIEEYRGRGADAVFYLETAQEALKHGYKRIEGSWILETNTMMNTIIERMGGYKYKTYRIYEKHL
jgi:hypothetical protein